MVSKNTDREDLYQEEVSKMFYEERFKKGYMSDWDFITKERVYNVIKNLSLPEIGTALDFGCGTGVFTDVLKKALPKWKIYGTDISAEAINNAKSRYPACDFFISDKSKPEFKFDFLFTHHVLEHVYDISKTINEINLFLKPLSFVLHIFPCGNEGSYEYNICKLRTDGISRNMEGRFFF